MTMILPVQITFRNMECSPAVEARIRAEAAKLETYYDPLISCRVMVEIPHRHHQRGNPFHVRLELGVPGEEIVVQREPTLHQTQQVIEAERIEKNGETLAEHKDMYVAIRDTFKAARRRLQDYARRHRGAVKTHEAVMQPGRVLRLFPAKGYGFLEKADGTEVYFHEHSVARDDFDALQIGMLIEYVEEPGEKGAQASYVKVLDEATAHSAVPVYQTA
jgi:cold shock CspA family protein/ribosome-associated translation inhibitor RaiA